MATYDLILQGGRVIDSSQDLDNVCDVAFSDGRVSAVEPEISASDAADTVDASGLIVTPGLVDLHTHVYWGGTSIGVDAEKVARRSGTTTFIDVGTAGPGNFAGFKHHVIDPSAVRILALLNISFPGIYAFSKSVMVGETQDIRLLDARECLHVAKLYPEEILGIKVRIGQKTSGANGLGPLHIAMEVADALGLPIMTHVDFPPPSLAEVLAILRPGDILTHCFRPFPNAPIQGDGKVREIWLEARERGIIFDIGHGSGSFGFGSAQAMLEQGIYPDTISSDVHCLNIDDGPAYDLLHTMSKFLCLGMPLNEVVKRSTILPAQAVNRSDFGTLKPGAVGDATVIAIEEGNFTYEDVVNETLAGTQRFACRKIIVNGRLWHEA
ncbi:MAG: amidohydrolase/deacetylase family metallohydrolase [Pseudomonadota bacterium]